MKKKLKLGIIGCGAITEFFHIPVLKKNKNIEIFGVVDQDKERAIRISKNYNIKYGSTDYEDIIDHIDAVLIATPNNTHYDLVNRMLDNSIHVLCEKPLAFSKDEVTSLYSKADQNSLTLSIGFQRRFSPNIEIIKGLIKDYGEPTFIEMTLSADLNKWPSKSAFRLSKSFSGGGCLIDTGIHLIDLSVFLLGVEYLLTYSELKYFLNMEVEDYAFLELLYNGKSKVRICSSYKFGLSNQLIVKWNNAWAKTSISGGHVTFFDNNSLLCKNLGVIHLNVEEKNVFSTQLEQFLNHIWSKGGAIVIQSEAEASHSIVEEVYNRGTKCPI